MKSKPKKTIKDSEDKVVKSKSQSASKLTKIITKAKKIDKEDFIKEQKILLKIEKEELKKEESKKEIKNPKSKTKKK